MTAIEAEDLLRNMPRLYAARMMRYSFLRATRPGLRIQTGRCGDSTAALAVRMNDDRFLARIRLARYWIDKELPAEGRSLLLWAWRGLSDTEVARKERLTLWSIRQTWDAMGRELSRYAGTVCGLGGLSCALCRGGCRLGRR